MNSPSVNTQAVILGEAGRVSFPLYVHIGSNTSSLQHRDYKLPLAAGKWHIVNTLVNVGRQSPQSAWF